MYSVLEQARTPLRDGRGATVFRRLYLCDTEEDIPAFAHSLFADYYRAKNPRTADEASLAELVKMMYNGKIEY